MANRLRMNKIFESDSEEIVLEFFFSGVYSFLFSYICVQVGDTFLLFQRYDRDVYITEFIGGDRLYGGSGDCFYDFLLSVVRVEVEADIGWENFLL